MGIDTPSWARDAIFYQVFPDRFAASSRVHKPGPLEAWDTPPTSHGFKGGDLLGIVERLDALDDLGVNALYLTPIFASASNHRYHAYDYLAVDPLLGGDGALRELLDAAHRRGMRVVLDGVFNHCGRGFWPFHHLLENGADSPYRGWFHVDPDALARRRHLRAYPSDSESAELLRLTASGTSPGEASRHALGYEAWWGLPALPKLNTDHPETREYLLGVAEHWLRFGTDGWRLDVAEEIDGGYWMEFRRRCRGVDPEAYLVAEIWHEKPEWLTGWHFDALMDYPLAQAIIGFAAGRHLDVAVLEEQRYFGGSIVPRDGASFAAELQRLLALYDPAVTSVMLNLLGSHDTPRPRTVMGGDLPAVRLATLLQMTLPGAPCIYYGDEIGMEGHTDPDCRRAYPQGTPRGEGADLRAFVRDVVRLRRGHRALRDGAIRSLGSVGSTTAFARWDATETLVIAANAGDLAAELRVDLPEGAGPPTLVDLAGWSVADPECYVRWSTSEPDGRRLLVGVPGRRGLVARLDPSGR